MEPILELIHVCFSYHTQSGETEALEDISLSVLPGEFLAVVGPSGCRKNHAPVADQRTSDPGIRRNPAVRKASGNLRCQHRLHAPAGSSV